MKCKLHSRISYCALEVQYKIDSFWLYSTILGSGYIWLKFPIYYISIYFEEVWTLLFTQNNRHWYTSKNYRWRRWNRFYFVVPHFVRFAPFRDSDFVTSLRLFLFPSEKALINVRGRLREVGKTKVGRRMNQAVKRAKDAGMNCNQVNDYIRLCRTSAD